jgi:ATP-dependent Lon protease
VKCSREQREYILRQQKRAIEQELGENEQTINRKSKQLREKIDQSRSAGRTFARKRIARSAGWRRFPARSPSLT